MPPAPPPAEMELLLGKLAMLDLSKRPRGAPPILGDQDNIAEATRAMQNAPIHEVVDISDEEEPPAAMPKENKAARLQRLVQRMERAIDNNAVADTVDEFRHVLTSYTARNLTKEVNHSFNILWQALMHDITRGSHFWMRCTNSCQTQAFILP